MAKHARGLLDTSVLVALDTLDFTELPEEVAISALSLAELAAGPHAAKDPQERARRQARLQQIEAAFSALSFDVEAARAYGRVYAAVTAMGGKARGPRAVDLMIAATALAQRVPVYTCNPSDFQGLTDLIEVVTLQCEGSGA